MTLGKEVDETRTSRLNAKGKCASTVKASHADSKIFENTLCSKPLDAVWFCTHKTLSQRSRNRYNVGLVTCFSHLKTNIGT